MFDINQFHGLAQVLILAVITSKINCQLSGEGLQQYYSQAAVVKPVQEENDDNAELSRYYRAEADGSVAQASLQYPQEAFQPVQYTFQSPAFQQQQLQPQTYYQQQQLPGQVLYQQRAQAQPQLQYQQQPQQLRSLQGFADPAFQQAYKHRMIYAAQENPTPRPQPARVQPTQQPQIPFQFQPQQGQQVLFNPEQQQFSPQPQQFPPQTQQFAPQTQQFAPQTQQFAPQPQQFPPQPQQFPPQPQPFAPQPQAPSEFSQLTRPALENPKLGVSYSSAGAVSKTSFSGLGVSYSF